MNIERLIENSKPFLEYILDWKENLKPLDLEKVLGGEPGRAMVISVDVIKGFAVEGPLAGDRVASIVDPVVDVFKRARELGVEHFILSQDSHDEDAPEFESYPPHGTEGSEQSEAVDEIRNLPFYDDFTIMPKNSIDPSENTGLDPWIDDHPGVDIFMVLGDCTDICTYQLALHLKTKANAVNRKVRVIVPENCTETYDLSVKEAGKSDAVPHDGDLLHLIFLYSMMLNGVEVVSRIE